MIRYSLDCAEGHRFESWFQSADAFDTLLAAGMVSCAVCGCTKVGKGLMAPSVATERDAPGAQSTRPLSRPASPAEQALADLRRRIEAESDYVGPRFAQEARDMHAGLTPHRTIHGEARLDEAKQLIEDGVPIAPLPFTPGRKTN
ncbi:DUF1178 family protein [Rhodovulum euryhalinum]|uniref:DUF1178 family protein n=1 Tax=Rhodovulum euryhalinum TaxID=35805 RepID=A0A4R2KCH2_9RHOB|nr:DUF1178 family protein [Rhodovulum euryhalinum]TCO71193.1 hypothetical protein EV655_10786 [Rhodovulum euryhalinum]